MPPLRLSESDLRPSQRLLLREADPRSAVQGPPSDDLGADRAPAAVRGRGGGQKGRGSRFRLKAPEPDENDVLSSVLTALLYHPRVADAYRMNTGAGKLLFADGSTSRFIRFGKKGSPDIHGWLTDGTALFVECKRPSGRIRPEQAKWIDEAREAGCVAFVARGIDCVKEHLG